MALKYAVSLVLGGLLSTASAQAGTHRETFMPENDLYKHDCIDCESAGGISQEQYLAVIAKAKQVFTPIISGQGGSLKIVDHWTDSTVNASATQDGSSWVVNMYGGLARRPEITVDGFAFVLCHEIGHHLGGFPFVKGAGAQGAKWAAAEGQADYFAAHVCPALLWGDETASELSLAVPDAVKSSCNDVWSTPAQQALCYRASLAGKSTTDLLAALGGTRTSYNKHDSSVVPTTYTGHPAAQCRLDTYLAAANCTEVWDNSLIPGKENGKADNTSVGEESAAHHSCTALGNYTIGLRPSCWFHATL